MSERSERSGLSRERSERISGLSEAKFDELIHAPTRLSIVALLAATDWADFKYIRDELGLSDSALSKQLATLEAAGYVDINKGFVGKRPRTTARLSPAGRAAFVRHVAALQEIVTPAGATVLPS
jgi:DNA-binding MarR family transcriptional regulator